MTNYFEVLGLPTSLLVDPAEVDSAWEKATREDHPDISEIGTGTTDANKARSVIGDPVTRLEHWLALQGIESRRDQSISPELMDLFTKLNPILTEADAIIGRLQKASSTLGKALLAKEAASSQLNIQSTLGEIMAMKQSITERYAEFETSAESEEFAASSEALAQLKFLKKWEQQGQVRLLTLLSA